MWRPAFTAPFGADLELAIIDERGEHPYQLPCRRTVKGWIDSKWLSPIDFVPTHWRPWPQQHKRGTAAKDNGDVGRAGSQRS